MWKTQRPEVCDTEIGAPLTLRRYSRAPLPAPAPDTGPSLRGSCTPFARVEGTSRVCCHKPQRGSPPAASANARSRTRAGGGVLSPALRARVHANPPGKPPRTRAPCAPRPRAPSRAPQNVREAPPARTALTRSAVPEHTADVPDSDGQTAAPAN